MIRELMITGETMHKFPWLFVAVSICLLGLSSALADQDSMKRGFGPPAHAWHTFLGGSAADAGQGIAVDPSGSILVSGHSRGAWGSPLSVHNGSLDVFVAKFDGSGTLLWHTFLGASSDDYNGGIEVDTSGNVYVTGKSASSWGSPIRAKNGGDDAFVAKLSGSGTLLWNTFLGGNGNDGCAGIALDGSGNVVVRGSSSASWGGPVRAYTGGEDIFAAKLSGSGTLLWHTFLGGGGGDYSQGLGIDTDPSDNVIVSGYTFMTSWGSPIRAHNGDYDAFAAKLDGNGNLLWNTFLGGSGSDNCYGVAVDGAGNLALTGDSISAWGTPVRAHSGSLDVFVAKLSGNGTLLWNTFLGGSSWDWVYAVAANSAGTLAVTGKSAGAWGSPLSVYSGGEDAFAALLDTNGALLWNTFLGSGGNDSGYGITVDGSTNVHVTGVGAATWGSPIRPFTSGNNDAFVAKIAANSTIAVLTTTSPNGGESWLIGSVHSITWTTTGTIANVKIEYSTNGGTSYTTVIASTANTGTYAWTVPNAPSANCLVKVSDAANAGIFDTGNAFFAIVAPLMIAVTAPNGGENLLLGSTHVITWSSTGTIASVKIDYSTNGGTSYTTIIASTANTGTYAWTVPNAPSANCLVKVSDAANAGIFDTSNAFFAIVVPLMIAVTAPNGGENLLLGSTHVITWSSTGTIASVKIEYSTNNGASWTTIIASTANTGTYTWTVPNAPSASCLVRISEAAGGTPSDASNAVFTISAATPAIALGRTRLDFGAVAGDVVTKSQTVMLDNSGGGTLAWTAASNRTWLSVAPASGTGAAALSVRVNPADLAAGLLAGGYSGNITVSDPNASNSPQTIAVNLTVYAAGATGLPFGFFDTPLDGTTGVTGAVPVTGWAADDIEVVRVEIWRDSSAGETPGQWAIGDAVFVEGARPDIEAALPNHPLNYRAGWGYMMLTNMLPGQGNGTVKLYAYAIDREGNRVLLGTKTIVCDNAQATKPFGTIDTPAQGGQASGNAFMNWGWVLTPLTKTVPKTGETILAYVDGVYVGSLAAPPNFYNAYRADVSGAFPGLNNTGAPGAGGPVGLFYLDTTKYANGVHTIAWVATDDRSAADGIGSRYFIIGAPSQTLVSIAVTTANSSIASGSTQPFAATGTYADGSTGDVTSSVTWSSSNMNVATISQAGLAAGIGAGSTTITAALGGLSGSATLTVISITLTSIAVTPANPSITLGTMQQFTATGSYSDGSARNITASTSWSSSNSGIASINAGGLAASAAIGSTTITAAMGGVTGSTTLTVTAVSPIKLFNAGSYPSINSIIESSSGHILVAGTQDNNATSVYALKLDAAGTQVWNRYYSAGVTVWDDHIFEVSSGGYVVSGWIDAGQGALFKMPLDASGAASPASYFDVWRATTSRDEVQLPNGSIVFAGNTSVKDNGATLIPYGDALLTGINSSGTLCFRQNYNFATENSDGFYAVIATSDGGFAAAGSTTKYEDGAPENAILAKTDALGNLLWFKNFGYISDNLGNDGAIDLVQLSDGGFAVLLRSGYGYQMYIIMTDAGGKFIKAVNIENYIGFQMITAADGGLVITGRNAEAMGVVIKLNSAGAKVWEYVSWFDYFDYTPRTIVRASDGTYLVAGSIHMGDEVYKTFVFKLDDAGRRVW